MERSDLLTGGYYGGGATEFLSEKRSSDQKVAGEQQHFTVDDLLDFPNDDDDINTDGFFSDNDNININTKTYTIDHSSTTFTTTDSCNSSSVCHGQSLTDCHLSTELFVPYDDLGELEWLSNFVEDSFSTDRSLHTNLHILSGSKPLTPESSSSETHSEPITRNPNNPIFQPETPFPGKARSKRSRASPCDWSTRLLHVPSTTKMSSEKKEKENPNPHSDTMVHKCRHCGAEKTPQWRTGPMGPKTLCNACGVRYKSGRLVPEYRPVASPTFVSTKHSNSHRKVIELRRQKELQRAQRQQFLSRSSIFGVSNGRDDFLVNHLSHSGHDFRQ